MDDRYESMEFLLLDLHLRRLGAEDAVRVEEALASSPELTARSRAVRDLFSLLDAVPPPEPPGDLADGVMARIERETATLPFREAASALPSGRSHDLSGTPVLSLRELIAIAACITLIVGIFVPGYFKARNIAQRNMCRDNLVALHQGMAVYARDNNGYAAYAGYVPGGSWRQTMTPGIRRVSTTKPLFLLLHGGYVSDPRRFVCPASAQSIPMLADDYRGFTDFAEPANVSYSSQFMNLPRGRRLEDMNPGMVLIGDRNPLGDSRAAHIISPYDESSGNSRSHEDGAGQCAVRVSGSAGWYTQPTIGVDRDNIYRPGDLCRFDGTEVPISPTDNYLLP